jgi:hypothetical protein
MRTFHTLCNVVMLLVPLVPLMPLMPLMLLLLAGGSGCTKNAAPESASAAQADLDPRGCNHEVKASAVAEHSWPYPADATDLRWGSIYRKMRLKLKPTNTAFVTATVTWKEGEFIRVEDSKLVIRKPRQLVAKRDLFVKRKVWDQGIEVERTFLAAAKGEVGSFLFYNSRGLCMVDTEGGPGWTPCTLDDAFEGLSEEDPFACEQYWWVKVRKSKVNQGWMVVAPGLTERVPRSTDAAK